MADPSPHQAAIDSTNGMSEAEDVDLLITPDARPQNQPDPISCFCGGSPLHDEMSDSRMEEMYPVESDVSHTQEGDGDWMTRAWGDLMRAGNETDDSAVFARLLGTLKSDLAP